MDVVVHGQQPLAGVLVPVALGAEQARRVLIEPQALGAIARGGPGIGAHRERLTRPGRQSDLEPDEDRERADRGGHGQVDRRRAAGGRGGSGAPDAVRARRAARKDPGDAALPPPEGPPEAGQRHDQRPDERIAAQDAMQIVDDAEEAPVPIDDEAPAQRARLSQVGRPPRKPEHQPGQQR
jgi:hypothetical protein